MIDRGDPTCDRLSTYVIARGDLSDDERTKMLAVIAEFEFEVLGIPDGDREAQPHEAWGVQIRVPGEAPDTWEWRLIQSSLPEHVARGVYETRKRAGFRVRLVRRQWRVSPYEVVEADHQLPNEER